MSNDRHGEGDEMTELEPLEPLDDLHDLEPIEDGAAGDGGHDDLHELEPLEPTPSGAGAADARAGEAAQPNPAKPASPANPGGAPSGPRELERAPLMLQKAAAILAVAALFPWLEPGGWVLPRLGAKAIILVGAYLLYNSVLFKHDEKVPGVFASLGKLHAMALDGLAFAVMLVGVLPVVDAFGFGPTVEKAALAIGVIAWCQILSYEKGSKFNPIIGLSMPLLGLAALGRIVTVFKEFDVFALLGSAGVLAAAGLSGYTLVLALKEAKAHGEAKKMAALEARKEQRKAKKQAESKQSDGSARK